MNTDLSFDRPVNLDFDGPKRKRTAGEEIGIKGQNVRTKSTRRRFYDLSRVPNAVRLINPLPRPGETIHAIMAGDFHAWDLVPAIYDLLGCPIAELLITTLGFNHANNLHLCQMIDAGQVVLASVVCSEYFRDADRDVFNAAEKQLAARGARIRAVRNHSKIICVKPVLRAGESGNYVIESSANLRSCNNLEQFTLTNDRELFVFHRRWILSLFFS
jgi:hypothetical protein